MTAIDYSQRFATCEARLRLDSALCTYISPSGSRYFDHPRLGRVRASDHSLRPSDNGEKELRWNVEIRVDGDDWQEKLDSLLGPLKASVAEMPGAVYFADHSAVSQSMLKVFADRRRMYEGYYVTHAIPELPDTDPMRKGTALHTAILEPHRFERIVVTFPRDMLSSDGAVRTNEAKVFRAEHEARGLVVLKESDAAKVRAMAESVKRVCREWFDMPAVREKPLYWTDEATGLPMKMRLDWLIEGGPPTIIDLKSTGDVSPAAFRKRIEQNGYWRQQAQYSDGVEEYCGDTPQFYFLAVEDSWPFAASLHKLDHDSARDARMARNREVSDLARCIESRDFSEPWERRVNPVTLSRFCFGTYPVNSSRSVNDALD